MRKAAGFLLLAAPLVAALGGCSQYSFSQYNVAWTGPGWYLEKPHVIIPGRTYYAGPISYDECEILRKKEASADYLLCVNEIVKPE